MKKWLIWALSTIIVIAFWGGINFAATTQGWFLQPIADRGDRAAFLEKISQSIQSGHEGNAAMVLLENGEITGHVNVSKDKPVTSESIFGVASLGKWVAAVGIMKLVEDGKLDLDTPVSRYLTRWQLPTSEFDNDGVTVRRLLSHTAGITDGLGHDGFPPGTAVQPLTEHLTLAADREPDKSGRVQVGIAPGTTFKYSGGSYNLLQLLIEEVSGESFSNYMQQRVFAPLNMHQTGYTVDRKSQQTAQYFGENRELLVYPNYTSLAATGLYSTTADLAKFVRAQIPSTALSHPGRRVLSDESIIAMHQPLGHVEGMAIWGAGVMLYTDNNQASYIVGHGGRSPMLNATARINPATGNGFIMLQTGNKAAFASAMATRWTNWETGNPDLFQLQQSIPAMLKRIAIGAAAMLIMSLLIMSFWQWRSKPRGPK